MVKNPELGLIRPGYLADMVLLTENPLADVKGFTGYRRRAARERTGSWFRNSA